VEGFLRPTDGASSESEAEEVGIIRSCHPAFLRIDLELERASQELLHALHDPLTRSWTLHQEDEVIRIADEPVATMLKLFVQVIQKDVGQEG